ncbi:hypothetical protein [Flavobacterium orientale]|uniref:RHS repeat-associated core domain-containing protein n=1 Tax=Flavobacterium orientale TaxID=1756020 RepID=A0A917DGS7_9FLAO|nr:hypothetical protein [Flavobacterium orientale]GGD34343.1 hypothetical protein GCM10011343_25300 [Flavobacterium orientale]
MLVPNRHGSAESYRYGFQGQEKDDEVKGEGNSLNYTFRMHDPRVGRFFAVDPLAPKYPFYSPYQFSGNRVIDMVELEGLEPAEPGSRENQKGSAFDYSLVTDNPGDALSFLLSYQEWSWHSGTKTTASGWYTNDDYKEVVMPFALDAAYANGWSTGTCWKSAKKLIGNPGPERMISQNLNYFLTSRVFDGSSGDPMDILSQIGAHEINSFNKALYYTATGHTESMDFSSPVFGMGLGLKGFALNRGKSVDLFRAISGDELIDIANMGFRNKGGYETGKLFATSAEDASNFGRLFYQADNKPFFIIKTSINTKYETLLFRTEMDLMEGISVPNNLFKKLNLKNTSVIDAMPLPNHPWIKN